MALDRWGGAVNWHTRQVGVCPVCGGAIWQKYGRGRRKRYCKNACRQIAYRARKLARGAVEFGNR